MKSDNRNAGRTPASREIGASWSAWDEGLSVPLVLLPLVGVLQD